MRRKTKRHPLLVYKLVLATTRAANRVHFVLEIIIMMMIGKNFMTRSMMTMTVRMMFQVTWWNYGASHVDADDDSDGDDLSDDDDDDNDDDDDDDDDNDDDDNDDDNDEYNDDDDNIQTGAQEP